MSVLSKADPQHLRGRGRWSSRDKGKEYIVKVTGVQTLEWKWGAESCWRLRESVLFLTLPFSEILLSKSTIFFLLFFFKSSISWSFVGIKLRCFAEWYLWTNFRNLEPISVFLAHMPRSGVLYTLFTDTEKGKEVHFWC